MEIKNYAFINSTGFVENVIAYDGVSPYPLPEGYQLIQSDVAAIGWVYVDNVFSNPNAEVAA